MPPMSASAFSCPTGHPSGCSGLRVSRKNMPFGGCVWCRRRLRCPPGRQGVSSLYGRARPPHIGRAGGRAGHLARPSLCSGPDTLGCVTPRLLDGSIQVKRGSEVSSPVPLPRLLSGRAALPFLRSAAFTVPRKRCAVRRMLRGRVSPIVPTRREAPLCADKVLFSFSSL